jgi:hypothetical protein
MAIPMVYWGTDCGISPFIIRKKFSLGVKVTAISFSSFITICTILTQAGGRDGLLKGGKAAMNAGQ